VWRGKIYHSKEVLHIFWGRHFEVKKIIGLQKGWSGLAENCGKGEFASLIRSKICQRVMSQGGVYIVDTSQKTGGGRPTRNY